MRRRFAPLALASTAAFTALLCVIIATRLNTYYSLGRERVEAMRELNALSELSDQDVEILRAHFLAQPDLPSSARQGFENATLAELRQQLTNSIKGMLTEHRDEFLKTKGVCCFTEGVENLLLWAHYSGKYRGFCLEFDVSKDAQLAEKLRKVDYVERPPVLDTMALLKGQQWEAVIQKLFCTKSNAWAYEHEWRGIHVAAGTEYCYPAEALTGVFFGPEIDFTSMEIIALILGGQNPHVPLWKGSRKDDEFKVVFEKMTYTAHIVAQNIHRQNQP